MLRALPLMFAISLGSFIAFAQEQASPAQTGDTTSSKATVYFYRYKQFVGSALAPPVFCDDAELAHMGNGRYFTVNLPAGQHTCTSNDKQAGINLDLKVGEEYFIRVEIATGAFKGHGRLLLVPREQASYELKSDELKALDEDKVTNKSLVSLDKPNPKQSANTEESKK